MEERPEAKVGTWAHFRAWLDSPDGQRYLELTNQDRDAVETDRCRGLLRLQGPQARQGDD